MKTLRKLTRAWKGLFAVAATLAFVPLTAGFYTAEAQPPRHAPAYGYRAKPRAPRPYRSTRTYRRTPRRDYRFPTRTIRRYPTRTYRSNRNYSYRTPSRYRSTRVYRSYR